MRLHITYILLACLTFVGCSESYDEKYTPNITPRFLRYSGYKTLQFQAKPLNTQPFRVLSCKTPWQIDNLSDWITLSEIQGDGSADTTVVNVGVQENKFADTLRTHILLLKSAAEDFYYSKGITVSQSAAAPYITPSNTIVEFSGKASTRDLSVQSNTAWDVNTSENWLYAEKSGKGLTISVSGNDTEIARTGYIMLVAEKITTRINVRQEPANLYAQSDTIVFDRVAGTYTLAVVSDLEWKAYTNDSWIQVSPEKGGVGEGKIEVSVTPNNSTAERIGSVYVTMGAKSIKIPILQHYYYAKTNLREIEFGSRGGTMALSVSSNDSWKAIMDNSDWLTLTDRSGVGSKDIILTAKDNSSVTSRSMSLLLDFEVCEDISLDIVQRPRYLTTSQNTIAFFGKGGTENLHINTDGQYRIEQNGDWFTISQSGDDIAVTAPENGTKVRREGSIEITMTDLLEGKLSVTIPVEQSYGGKVIDKSEYDDDTDWSDDKSEWTVKLSVIGYKTDEDWSTNPDKSESTINISEYATDVDMTTGNIPSSFNRVLYDSTDVDWTDRTDQNNSNINHSDYSNDEEWTNKE